MHDTNPSARVPASEPVAERPLLNDLLATFEKQLMCTFKEESYLVRDNGAVLRRPRPIGRRRKLDRIWTFGKLNRHSGYLEINGHVVHRIVAAAFHGPRPSTDHVVDHIDTNRQNNRPDNLRYVTRLENILLNPTTRARIEIAYGSLEAFFENPGARAVPNWEWMRTVTKEEAEISRKRLEKWAESGQGGRGGTLGDWIFKPKPQTNPIRSGGLSRPPQRLNRCKQDFSINVFVCAAVSSKARIGTHRSKCRHSLGENFFSMRHKQYTLKRGAVEGT